MDYFFSLLLLQGPWLSVHFVMLIGHHMWMTGVPPQGLQYFLVQTNILVPQTKRHGQIQH